MRRRKSSFTNELLVECSPFDNVNKLSQNGDVLQAPACDEMRPPDGFVAPVSHGSPARSFYVCANSVCRHGWIGRATPPLRKCPKCHKLDIKLTTCPPAIRLNHHGEPRQRYECACCPHVWFGRIGALPVRCPKCRKQGWRKVQ